MTEGWSRPQPSSDGGAYGSGRGIVRFTAAENKERNDAPEDQDGNDGAERHRGGPPLGFVVRFLRQ